MRYSHIVQARLVLPSGTPPESTTAAPSPRKLQAKQTPRYRYEKEQISLMLERNPHRRAKHVDFCIAHGPSHQYIRHRIRFVENAHLSPGQYHNTSCLTQALDFSDDRSLPMDCQKPHVPSPGFVDLNGYVHISIIVADYLKDPSYNPSTIT